MRSPMVTATEQEHEAFSRLLGHLHGLIGQVFVFGISHTPDDRYALAMVAGVLGAGETLADGSVRFAIRTGPHSAGTFTVDAEGLELVGFEEAAGELVLSWWSLGVQFHLVGRPGAPETRR